jgi:hypothetical protein
MAFIWHQQSYEKKMLFPPLLRLNTEHFSNGWLYKRKVNGEFNRMPIAGAFVVNFNLKFPSVFGGHSVVNNTYEILLLLKAIFFFAGDFSILFRPSLGGVHDHLTAVLKSTIDMNVYGHLSGL